MLPRGCGRALHAALTHKAAPPTVPLSPRLLSSLWTPPKSDLSMPCPHPQPPSAQLAPVSQPPGEAVKTQSPPWFPTPFWGAQKGLYPPLPPWAGFTPLAAPTQHPTCCERGHHLLLSPYCPQADGLSCPVQLLFCMRTGPSKQKVHNKCLREQRRTGTGAGEVRGANGAGIHLLAWAGNKCGEVA